jgi:hypothetical protein
VLIDGYARVAALEQLGRASGRPLVDRVVGVDPSHAMYLR